MSEICGVTGKQIYQNKDMARKAVRHLKVQYKGRCSAIWCIYCSKYHVTKGLRGRKGRGDFR